MNRKLVLVIVAIAVLIGFPAISPAGDSSVFHGGEGWLLRAYTDGGVAPYTVKFEVVSTGNSCIDHNSIVGLAANPLTISISATSPDVSLSFDPSTSTAYVFYTDAAGLELASVAGLVGAGPRISANQNSLAFGSVNVGSNADKTLIVSNSGNADLTLGTINVSGSGFTRNGGTCSNGEALSSSAPGNSCTVIVRFAPASAGASAGTLAITSDDPKTPSLAVSLTGTGASGSVGGVDLVITSLTGQKSVDNNVAFPVSVTVKNQGSAAATGFTVKGYFSVDEVPDNGGSPADKLLFTWDVPGLAAGATASNSFGSKFTGFPIHHPYYVVVKADADDQVAEANETNNVADYSTYVSR